MKNLFSPKTQDRLKILTDLISLGMCALLTYVSWQRFWYSYTIEEEMMAAVRILWWWGRIAMPIGMGLFTIAFFLQLFQRTAAGGRKEI